MSFELTSRFLESDWYNAQVWPFIEDDNCDITGYGHQDLAEFAAAVNHYDRTCNNTVDENDYWTAADVGHDWIVVQPDGESYRRCARTERGAVAVTTLWGSR